MVRIVFMVLEAILYVKGVWTRSKAQARKFWDEMTVQSLGKLIFATVGAVIVLVAKLTGADLDILKDIFIVIAAFFAFLG